MNEQVINELCERFHTTVDNLIPVYADYAIAKDMAILAIATILLIVGITVIIILKQITQARLEDEYDWFYELCYSHLLLCIGIMIVIICSAVCILTSGYDLMLWHMSPQMRFFDCVVGMGQ